MALFSRLIRPSGNGAAAAKPASEKTERRYASVEIVPPRGPCCKAVEAIAGQRLLTDEAPCLPLPDCDQPICNCTYKRYTDRRTDIRRDADVGIGIASQMYNDGCRRDKAAGRRNKDKGAG